MAILIGSKAASRTVMQRPANKTFDMVLAVNALSSYDSGSNPDSGAPFLLALAFSLLFKRSSDFCSLISDSNH